jgi:hypothetical protein
MSLMFGDVYHTPDVNIYGSTTVAAAGCEIERLEIQCFEFELPFEVTINGNYNNGI